MVIMDHLTMMVDTTPPAVKRYMEEFSLTREEAEQYRNMILAEEIEKFSELINADKKLADGHR